MRLATLLFVVFGCTAVAGEPNLVIDLWPGKAPGETGDLGPETIQPPRAGEGPVKRVGNVSKPTLSVFRPAKDKDTGCAVVIAPGGGYNILAFDKEGEEVAAFLNTVGVTGIVLKYRVPRRAMDAKGPPLGAKQDAQRALSLVRAKAGDWGIDPKRIGMLGFSAGGHLTAWTATNFDQRSYEAIDTTDKVSCRPDFAVLVYAAYLSSGTDLGLNADIRVSKESPPAFLAHAGDDNVKAENSIAYYMALRKAGVPSELHIYPSGGHGFGLRPSKHPVSEWPRRCADWLTSMKFSIPR